MKTKTKFFVAVASLSLVATAPANAADIVDLAPSGNFELIAFGPNTVWATVETNNSSPVNANGADWYFWAPNDDSGSFAVMPENDTANLGECGSFSNSVGMCWHMNYYGPGLHFNWGYNYNTFSGLTSNSELYRAIYTSSDPGYYPAGIQQDISVDSLEGWELCWLDDWDENFTLISDIKANCSGDFIAVAVGSELGEPAAQAEEEDNLAATGFDATALAAIGAVAAVGGALVLRRRRTS